MVKRYFVNPFAVLFHPSLDLRNHYKTIVYNPTTEEIFKISRFGYKILEVIDKNPGISAEEISRLTPVAPLKIQRFLEIMNKENVIFTR